MPVAARIRALGESRQGDKVTSSLGEVASERQDKACGHSAPSVAAGIARGRRDPVVEHKGPALSRAFDLFRSGVGEGT
jgi:hypothetical protein